MACILAATLTPMGTAFQPDFARCVICGSRGMSDALVNVILFAPLGAALAIGGRTGLRPVLLGGMLSCLIEAAQLVIPGRDPSLGDVVSNTAGTAVGQVIVWAAHRWLFPDVRTAARLSLLAALAVLAVFAGGARLLAPVTPQGNVRAWYTPDLLELEWYHGRVRRSTLGPLVLKPGPSLPPGTVTDLVLGGVALRIQATTGQRTRRLAPLLEIADDGGRELVLVGADRGDLVLRYRQRAADWRLDQPDLRLRGALAALAPGDPLDVEVRRDIRGYCLTLNRVSRCGVGYSVGSGWALLYYPRHFPVWALTMIEAGWIAGLVFPVGLWARRRPETALAVALLVLALFALPPTLGAGLVRTPAHQIAGAVAGLMLGRLVQAWHRAVNVSARLA